MGIVYKARDSVLGRLVALKVMTSGLADNAEVRERFLREARSVSNLQHANIVVVHELGEHAGMPYIVMEYLDGETLELTIRNRRPLIVLQKIDIILQVAKALHYAHEKGVIHRDVKPGNIMLLLDGSIKVVDFGIAHLADQTITRTGMVLGTVAYMSPEQLNGQAVDGRTDIFSLGIVFHLLLTGKLPFEGASTAQTIMKILLEPPPRLEQVGDIDPPELQPIMDRALAKKPQDRYQTCAEFSEHLTRSRKRINVATQLGRLEQERQIILAEAEQNCPSPRRERNSAHLSAVAAGALPTIVSHGSASDSTPHSRDGAPTGHGRRLFRIAAIVSLIAALVVAIPYLMHKVRDRGVSTSGVAQIAPDYSSSAKSTLASSASSQPDGAIPQEAGTGTKVPSLQSASAAPPQPLPKLGQLPTGRGDHLADKASAPLRNDAPLTPKIEDRPSHTPRVSDSPPDPAAPVLQTSAMAPLPQFQAPPGVAVLSSREAQKVTIPSGAQLAVRLKEALDSKSNRPGSTWSGTVAVPIQIDNRTLVPAGTEIMGRMVDPSRSINGIRHGLVLEVSSMRLNGRTYRIQTNQWAQVSLKRRDIRLAPGTELNFQLIEAVTITR